MFRRKEDTIGADYSCPADLKELGFFTNELGQIRMIDAPDKEYFYHCTNNERYNEMCREAMQECSRQEVEKRLSLLGISRIYLPGFTTAKPDGPHVPILAPAPEILKTRKRIIVIVNDDLQDVGILAYRQLQRDLGLNGASAVDLVKKIIKRSATSDEAEKYKDIFEDDFKLEDHEEIPALVVLNTGQLLYSHKHNKVLTMHSWSAMPRKSMTHDMIKIHDENRVQGHNDPAEHVKTCFDDVLHNPSRCAPDAEIYLIAIENGSDTMLSILEEDFHKYSPRITAMALIHTLMDDTQIKNPKLRTFLHQRTRQWRYSDLTNDPQICTELPENYSRNAVSPDKNATEHIAWSENIPKTGGLSSITNALHRLAVSVVPAKAAEPAPAAPALDNEGWGNGQSAMCPTFAGGPESVGECVLTNPATQDAILSFFEEVAQDPQTYRNPALKIYTSAPQPTPDNPLALDPEDPSVADPTILPAEMTPEQAEIDDAKATVQRMKAALKACPENAPEFEKGRAGLIERISKLNATIETLEYEALATGGLTANEAPEKRESWPQGDKEWSVPEEGKQVKFAGTTVDSEMLKSVGLFDTAEEELAKLADEEA